MGKIEELWEEVLFYWKRGEEVLGNLNIKLSIMAKNIHGNMHKTGVTYIYCI